MNTIEYIKTLCDKHYLDVADRRTIAEIQSLLPTNVKCTWEMQSALGQRQGYAIRFEVTNDVPQLYEYRRKPKGSLNIFVCDTEIVEVV